MMRIILLVVFSGVALNCHASFIPAMVNPVNVSDIVFVNLGTYRGFLEDGTEYQKTYFVTRHFGDAWSRARSFCSSYNLQFTSLNTLEEARAFLHFADINPYFKRFTTASGFYMDAMTSILKTNTEWYWTDTGNKISYSIPWLAGQPDNYGGDEYCLMFRRNSPNQNYGFADMTCSGGFHFTCQRIDFLYPSN